MFDFIKFLLGNTTCRKCVYRRFWGLFCGKKVRKPWDTGTAWRSRMQGLRLRWPRTEANEDVPVDRRLNCMGVANPCERKHGQMIHENSHESR